MITSGSRRATRPCILVKAYQRRSVTRLKPLAAARSSARSTWIGWWMVAIVGSPSLGSRSRP